MRTGEQDFRHPNPARISGPRTILRGIDRVRTLALRRCSTPRLIRQSEDTRVSPINPIQRILVARGPVLPASLRARSATETGQCPTNAHRRGPPGEPCGGAARNRVEEFDFEFGTADNYVNLSRQSYARRSLQAAPSSTVATATGLAFSEIHRLLSNRSPIGRLIEEEERAHRAAEAEVERRRAAHAGKRSAADRRSELVRSGPPQPEADRTTPILDAQVEEAAAEEARPFAG